MNSFVRFVVLLIAQGVPENIPPKEIHDIILLLPTIIDTETFRLLRKVTLPTDMFLLSKQHSS